MNSDWPEKLERWYRARQRALPWRSDPAPYRVWISEVMLQQTQVVSVIPYFERFMAAFPTSAALAAAPEAAVLKAWEGLGYYSRARNLIKAAQMIESRWGGRIPSAFEDLKTLPGIGDYSAAAIASVAFGRPAPVVDGNVVRVYARFAALAENVASAKTRKTIFAALTPVIEKRDPSTFNQAMMELGALVCRPTKPDCASCPLRDDCRAFAEGLTALLPIKTRKAAVPEWDVAVGVIARDGRRLIQKRGPGKPLAGLWEFPGGRVETNGASPRALARVLMEKTGVRVRVGDALPMVKHAFSHFKIRVFAYRCEVRAETFRPSSDECPLAWADAKELETFPLSTVTRKILALT